MSSTNFTLYNIASYYDNILRVIDSVDEVEKLDDKLWLSLFEIGDKLDVKMENYAYIVKRFQNECDYLDEEIKRLKKRKEIRDRKIEWLKENMKNVLLGLDIKKIERPDITIRVQDSPPSVKITDERKIPAEFKEIVMTAVIRKKEILNHFKQTGDIPSGCSISRGKSLRIA